MFFKAEVHLECLNQVNARIQTLQHALNELTSGAENDTKSSAGDKHETGRAMMQMEHEKISRQLSEVLLQKATLEQIDPQLHHVVVEAGSLVKTNHGNLYISIALGKLNIAGKEVMTLSMQSPLAQKLARQKANTKVEMNGTHYIIEEVM